MRSWEKYTDAPTTLRYRQRKRMGRMQMDEKRERWRITFDELCFLAGITHKTFDEWADQGVLGKRLTSRADQGRGRHITRETAQRTILVARLVAAGMHPVAAGCVVQGHRPRDTSPLLAELPGGVSISIDRSDLP